MRLQAKVFLVYMVNTWYMMTSLLWLLSLKQLVEAPKAPWRNWVLENRKVSTLVSAYKCNILYFFVFLSMLYNGVIRVYKMSVLIVAMCTPFVYKYRLFWRLNLNCQHFVLSNRGSTVHVEVYSWQVCFPFCSHTSDSWEMHVLDSYGILSVFSTLLSELLVLLRSWLFYSCKNKIGLDFLFHAFLPFYERESSGAFARSDTPIPMETCILWSVSSW
jgi:hypothetical protein